MMTRQSQPSCGNRTRAPQHSPAALCTSFAQRLPPEIFFVTSALFHYIGPGVRGIAVRARRPAWRRVAANQQRRRSSLRSGNAHGDCFVSSAAADRRTVIALGVVLAAMNINVLSRARAATARHRRRDRVLGPIALAAFSLRGPRNVVALALCIVGVYWLIDLRCEGAPLGYVFAFANCALFMLYIVLGHRLAADGGARGYSTAGRCDAGRRGGRASCWHRRRAPAFAIHHGSRRALAWASARPSFPIFSISSRWRVCHVPRFALMLTLLPATATVVGMLVLGQIPTPLECAGIGLIIAAIAIHRRAS